jgi:integrase
MPLHLRKRGETWHCYGTVRVGQQSVAVKEFSTGRRTRADAEAVSAAREAEIRGEILDGGSGRAKRVTIADCLLDYLRRPGGVKPYDQDRIADLNERIGHRLLAEAPEAWAEWLRTRGTKMAPATAARWRATLQAAIAYGSAQRQVSPPKLATVKQQSVEGTRYLSLTEQDRLLAAYNEWVAPVALLLCFGGLRTQEALQANWQHVDWKRQTIYLPKTKNGKARVVPLHPRVLTALQALWEGQGRPTAGHVFLSRWGKPYTDTRETGGNPITKAHATACKAAGIKDFRPHDWRHHWASWMIMTGCDTHTLMKIGGWKSPKMVQRYAAVSDDHLDQAIRRLA